MRGVCVGKKKKRRRRRRGFKYPKDATSCEGENVTLVAIISELCVFTSHSLILLAVLKTRCVENNLFTRDL